MQWRLCLLLPLALTQFGCSVSMLTDVARGRFSRQHSCPESRLTMHAAPIPAHDLLTIPDAPPDVAADAGRLAVWRTTAHDRIASYHDLTAIRVSGCEVEQTYLCWLERAPYGDDYDYQCQELDLNAASSQLETFTLDPTALQTLHQQLAAGTPP